MNLGVIKNTLTLIIDTMFIWGVLSIWHYQSYHSVFSASISFFVCMIFILLYVVFEALGYSLSSYLTESVVQDHLGHPVSSFIRLKRTLYKYMFITTMTINLFGLYLFYDGYLFWVTNEKSIVFVETLFVGWWFCFTVYMLGVWLKTSAMFYDGYTNTMLGCKPQSFF